MTALALPASALVLAMTGALVVMLAGAAGKITAAAAAPAALLAGAALLAQPFLGIAALTAFSHLDAVQKALFGFLPVSAFKLIAAATIAALLVNARDHRDRLRAALRDPVPVMAILFLALAAPSFVKADDRALALAAIQSFLDLAILLWLVVILARTRNQVAILLWILVLTSVLSAVLVLADFTLGVQLVAQSDAASTARTVEGVTRSAGGSDYNPTTAAALLLVGAVFALTHALESPVWRRRLLLAVGLCSAAVVLSFARSAALAYGLVLLALLWRHRRARRLPLIGALALLAGLALAPFVPDEYWLRLSSIVGGAPDPTLGRRLSYNLIGADLFLRNPLFGVGPGNFFHHFTDPAYRFLPGRTLLGRDLHNMYLSVLVQHGLIGALPFFAILALTFRNLRAVWRAPADDAIRVQALALGYAFAAYLATALFLPSEHIKYTWILPGLAVSLRLANEKERLPP